MKKILTTLCFTLLALSHYSYALIDPDSLDPGLSVVSYLIPADNMKIESYTQGKPSHLRLVLCRNCIEKTYKISDSAVLELSRKPLQQDQLTIQIMKKEYAKVRVFIDRTKAQIISLHLDANSGDAEPPEENGNDEDNYDGVIKL